MFSLFSTVLILVQVFGFCRASTPANWWDKSSNQQGNTNDRNFTEELEKKLKEEQEKKATRVVGWKRPDPDVKSNNWNTEREAIKETKWNSR